jgi:hypothetical protein
VIESWRTAAQAAQKMSLPYPELLLLLAILQHESDDQPDRRTMLRRVRLLTSELELELDTLVPGAPPGLSVGRIEVEREVELPRVG